MIRIIAVASMLAFITPAMAAAPSSNPPTSTALEPALEQCIRAALAPATPGEEAGPNITDCISVGSVACQNDAGGGTSNPIVVRCDGEEQAFWDSLIDFEYGELQTALKGDALATLKRNQKAWTPWRSARCDLVKQSEAKVASVDIDVSYCQMDTSAQRAIDLMQALSDQSQG